MADYNADRKRRGYSMEYKDGPKVDTSKFNFTPLAQTSGEALKVDATRIQSLIEGLANELNGMGLHGELQFEANGIVWRTLT